MATAAPTATNAPRATSPTARLARWSGPALALMVGLALAYTPSFRLWSASVPYVLAAYQEVQLSAADLGLALIAAIGWLAPHPRPLAPAARACALAGIALLVCLALSIGAAQAPQLAGAALVRCALGLLAALALARRPTLVRWLILGGVGTLLVQALFAAMQLATQSSFPANHLLDGWASETMAAMSGAAVVIMPDGARWQRAAGTFPHPNILGGFVAVGLVATLPHLLHATQRDRRIVALWALGWLLLLLTFSRAALLAALLGCGCAALAHFNRRTIARLTLAPLAALTLVAIPFGPLLGDRFAPTRAALASPAVQERTLIADIAWRFIRQDPLRGVGAGNFTLAELRPEIGAISVEPVHLVPLLVAAEAGLIAGLAWLALLVAPLATEVYRTRRLDPARLALPLTLLTLAALDHYFWTFGPGRALFWLALGTWLANTLDEFNGQRSTVNVGQSHPLPPLKVPQSGGFRGPSSTLNVER